MEIIIILACIPLYVLNSFCDKYISTQSNKTINTWYNIIKFAVGALILFPFFFGESAKFQMGIIICGILNGLILTVSKTLMLYGYEKSSVAFMTLCHSSGMLLPCIVGHFLWDEKLTLLAFVGIILVIISILLLKNTKGKSENSLIGVGIGMIILLTSGGVMILQKIMGIYFQGMGVSAFNFYGFASAVLFLNCIPGKKVKKNVDFKKISLCAIGSAVSLCVINIVMTTIASTVPSVIMFPLFNGTGVILVTLLSAKVFKEKLTVKSGAGMIIGLLGLFLTNM